MNNLFIILACINLAFLCTTGVACAQIPDFSKLEHGGVLLNTEKIYDQIEIRAYLFKSEEAASELEKKVQAFLGGDWAVDERSEFQEAAIRKLLKKENSNIIKQVRFSNKKLEGDTVLLSYRKPIEIEGVMKYPVDVTLLFQFTDTPLPNQ